jgi:hypothetical protein
MKFLINGHEVTELITLKALYFKTHNIEYETMFNQMMIDLKIPSTPYIITNILKIAKAQSKIL